MDVYEGLSRLGVMLRRGVAGEKLTTFGSGGGVDCLLLPKDERELAVSLARLTEEGIPYRVIGGGSNLLIADEGYRGALIKLTSFDRIEERGRTLTVGAGVKMPFFAYAARMRALAGVEFACGIPGTVGGAAAVNAGAFGEQMSDLITGLRAMTPNGKVVRLDPRELSYDYHSATLPKGLILLSVTMRLAESEEGRVLARMREMTERRRATQPAEPSAGSVFRKVNGTPAALCIERTGLKGTRLGGAQISEKHCNFIVNRGGATTKEYFALAERVKSEVRARFGVTLEYEVEKIC